MPRLFHTMTVTNLLLLHTVPPVLCSILHASTRAFLFLVSTGQQETSVETWRLPRNMLLCTTKYYSVLQSTTPVLLCTTKSYSVLQSTTTKYYYKVLLQYHFLRQSITPVLLCTTPVLLLTKHCAPAIYPNFNQCCACPEK